MHQIALSSARAPKTAEWLAAFFDQIRTTVHNVTPKEFAFALDIQPSYLNDALRGVERKRFQLEWLPTLYEKASDDDFAALVGLQASWRNYRLERIPVLTPEQELAALRETVGRLAPAVLELADEQIKGRGR